MLHLASFYFYPQPRIRLMAYVSFPELVHAARMGTALISFPTDTVPALASHPDQAHLIFAAKQRSTTKPLILMAASADDLWPYVNGTPAEHTAWQDVARQYWPGALTLVLPASDRIPVAMNPQNPTTLGIRVPNSAVARHILSHTGPLATTSVNRSGEPPLLSIDTINQSFPEVLTLSLHELEELERSLSHSSAPSSKKHPQTDNAQASAPTPSTVVQWAGQSWIIARQGSVYLQDLKGN